MAIKRIVNGVPIIGPPYTKSELADFYGRQDVVKMTTTNKPLPAPKKSSGKVKQTDQ